MNSPDMNLIVEKIRASGCLSERELQRQVTMVKGCETLMRIDQWDRWWEAEVKRHVCRAAKLGQRHMPAISDAAAMLFLGSLLGGIGLFFKSETIKSISDEADLRWLAVVLLVVACLMFVQAVRSFLSARRYKPVLGTYQAGRRAELESLASEHRPGARMCVKCLKYTV